jgi:3-hydroxybutyryl-CoA dehydrogenase
MMNQIAVIGSGTMGNGIAHVFALHGYPVNLVDVSSDALERAVKTINGNLDRQMAKSLITGEEKADTLKHLHTSTNLKKAVAAADLVIEAATENETVKLGIFRELDAAAPREAVLASNTSSISITRIASVTSRAEKVIGMHFMNPVPVMKLVELINGYRTDPAVTRDVFELARSLGKTPCIVNDYPGFVSNRILMPMINEAVEALFQGVAGVEEIDTVMTLGMAHPMGPLALADFIGLDVCLAIMEVLQKGFGGPRYAPCPLLRNMVAAGRLGVKTAEGFYRYTRGTKEKTVSDAFKK